MAVERPVPGTRPLSEQTRDRRGAHSAETLLLALSLDRDEVNEGVDCTCWECLSCRLETARWVLFPLYPRGGLTVAVGASIVSPL